jgi:hypothetical protein
MADSSNTNKIIIGAQKYNDNHNKIKVTLKKKLIPVVKQPKPQKKVIKQHEDIKVVFVKTMFLHL